VAGDGRAGYGIGQFLQGVNGNHAANRSGFVAIHNASIWGAVSIPLWKGKKSVIGDPN